MQSEEASYIVIERGVFLKKRLNPAVEKKDCPRAGDGGKAKVQSAAPAW